MSFKEEIIDFTTNEITSVNEDFTLMHLYSKTIRGAVDVLYKNAVYGYNDLQIVVNILQNKKIMSSGFS